LKVVPAKLRKALKELKGLFIAAAIVLIVILGLYAYSGLWPPLVVVESESMQHSDTTSYIGVIDTGDLVIVKKISSLSEVKTYVASMNEGYRTYGDYGDVIIYQRDGSTSEKPVIHRAMVELVYNSTSNGFDVPSLADSKLKWSASGEPLGKWYGLTGTLKIEGVGYLNQTLNINLKGILDHYQNNGITPHGGLITKGDHNAEVDQSTMIARQPVITEWIIGEARGELPWFGLLKLWVQGDMPSATPENSKTDLIITIALIIAIPVVLDVSDYLLKRKGIDLWATVRRKLGMRPRPPENGPDLGKKK
jgi:signal peptidase